jgi:hypothetical protein
MPTPLDPAALPDNIRALRVLLLQREDAHAAELATARAGLQEQVLRNELLKARLAKLLRERFGASSEILRGAIEQLELLLGDLEEQLAETAPPEPEEPSAEPKAQRQRRKPVRKPLPQHLPRDTIEHPAPCSCPRFFTLARTKTIVRTNLPPMDVTMWPNTCSTRAGTFERVVLRRCSRSVCLRLRPGRRRTRLR